MVARDRFGACGVGAGGGDARAEGPHSGQLDRIHGSEHPLASAAGDRVIGAAGTALLVVIVGVVATWSVIGQKPSEVLREQ